MSKAEILAELPKLPPEERREIFDRICDLEENYHLQNGSASPNERALLDAELEDYQANPGAGSAWNEVEERIRQKRPK